MRETLYRGRIVTLERIDGTWEFVKHDDAVAVLAVDGAGRVLGVVQRRPAVDAVTWELPAGLIDEGETPDAAARRELAEEAGLQGTLRHVTRGYVSPGFTDELVHLFEATDLSAAHGHHQDEDEDVRVSWRDPVETWHAIAAGEVVTSIVTVLGLRHLLAARGIQP